MPVSDLFSKRQKKLRGAFPDVFTYDKIPNKLRVQIIHIIRDAVGKDRYSCNYAQNVYRFIHEALCREYGVFTLKQDAKSNEEAVLAFFLNCEDSEQVLDVVETAFKSINSDVRKNEYVWNTDRKISPDDALSELNHRFKEHGIGYQFESNELIRIDSTFLHTEVIKPTLALLSEKMFNGANEEFLKAHEHYRHGRNKECLNDCLKSFESVMKAICKRRKWSYTEKDTAKKLIEICFSKELIPNYLQSQFTGLRSLLESGIPTLRNRLGGHGQGVGKVKVDDYIAGYALHMTASNIFFLMSVDKKEKK
ncbi:MAG TPA: STM4504/CBY_0614 family protein [Candidatus Wujingus californicus]|uniref:STM4504/CBY_0614 family protein n=1 Tax=Candidatus Wujingus californicus TaxID=3367618 RepID=UPI0040276DD2